MKKRNKRYNPRRFAVDCRLPPFIKAQAAVSTSPLDDAAIDAIVSPLADFQTAMKRGTATQTDFWNAIESAYLFADILSDLKQTTLNHSDPAQNAYLHAIVDACLSKAENVIAPMLEQIGMRYQDKGAFIASGDQHREIDRHLERFRAILTWLDMRQYYQSVQRVNAVMAQAAHRNNKRYAAECVQ